MSLFRKPKKIQRRVFTADDEESDGAGGEDPLPPPPPIISRDKKENKPVKSTALLSFVDEEEDGEVFKVRKSKQSSRLAKLRDKQRRRAPDGDNNSYDNIVNEEKLEENNHDKPKSKKKSLEGLILSGREALAADGKGDVSDEEGEEEDDSRGFHQYRAESVRAALAEAPGHIPDAALIHAARKTRQQARELGGDFIPVKSESTPGSRLIRDDGSGDDEEEGRIHVRGLELPSDKPQRGTAAASDEELNSEPDEWEEQQIKKAMPALPDITGDGGIELSPFAVVPPPPPLEDAPPHLLRDGGIELNPFAVAPPPPRLEDAPPHLRPLSAPGQPPPASAQDLIEALRKRLQELEGAREERAAQCSDVQTELLCARRVRESRGARTGELDAAYRRAQAARGYLTDLIECLDEKMPELESLEARALALHRRRCEFLTERRRADLRDQAQDVLAQAARPGAAKPVDTEEKIRRCAEREGRRRARRLAREAAAAAAGAAAPAHRDGDSSDDDLPPAEAHHYRHEREAIREMSRLVFADALPAWRDVRGVAARLARWRRRDPAAYCDGYLPDCLPRLLAPYVRHQLILWNPIADEDNEDYERMDWYKCLMMYGVQSERPPSDSEGSSEEEEMEETTKVSEGSVREDPDLMLVPTILGRVVFPKVAELVEHAWDPMCVRACIRLRQLIVRACGVPGAARALPPLAAAATRRLAAALHADVFLPALPPPLLEASGGPFWRRCLGAGVRLLRAALALTGPPDALRADPLVLALLETLCCACGAAPPQYMSSAAVALAETLPRAGALRAAALRRIAALAALALSRLHSDNPLHLKALEQARAVIADAKAAE